MNLREYQELVDNKQKEVNRELRNLEDIDSRLRMIHSNTGICLCTEIEDGRLVTIKVSDFIPENIMRELLDKTLAEMNHARSQIERRLDKALGIERKPAIENPDFKAAVDDMVNQTKAKHKEEPKETKGRKVTVTDKIDAKVVQDMLNQGYSQAVIAKKVGVSAGTMCQFIKANKLVKSDKHKAPNEGTGVDPKEVQKLIDKGYDDTSIGAALGISRTRVCNIIKENNLVRKKVEKKEVSWEERLTEKIPEIKALYTNGPFSLKKLADEFSCDVKVLHAFLENHGLLKPSKNDPFKGR